LKKFAPCFITLVLLLFWEAMSRLQPSLQFVLPPPSKVFSTLLAMKERFFFHTLMTLKEIVLGFTLACLVAFPLAWCMFYFRTMRSVLQPLFVLIQCIPMFTLAPLMVIWFGWGLTAIIVPTALMIFFPLTLNLYQGLRSTPQALVDFFQLNGATPWQMLIKLRLPAALPHIFSGLRLSAAIAGIGAVAGEWAGAQQGLGILMLESRRNSDLEITFGALFCLSCLTLILYGIVLLLERTFQHRKKLTPFLMSLLLICLASCSKPKETRLLLDWLPNPNHIPLYVGVEQGYFAQEDIHLVIQKMFDNGGGMSYLISGKADLLLAHLPGTLKACSLGAQVQILDVIIPVPLRGFIFKKNLNIHTPEHLSGYRLGYCIGGPDTTFLDFLLNEGHIEPSTRKNVSADLIAAMGTGAVDMIYGGFWNIEPYQLQSLGVSTSYFPIEMFHVPSYQELIVVSKAHSAQAHPRFVQGFRTALEKSISFCREHPEEAFQIYLACNPDKSLTTKTWEFQAWKATYPLLPKSQAINKQTVEDFYHWQLQQGILSQPISLHSLLSLYPEA